MAAYTLFDISYRVARELGILIEGVVTSAGTPTTTYDITDLKDRFADDYFNGGMLWILYDYTTPVALTAPQGEWARVTDFSQSLGKITHTALTTGTNLLDRYAVSNREFSKDIMLSCINTALSEIQIATVDTTLTTAADTTEYDLPVNMLDQRIKVWLQRSTTTDHNLWIEVFDWYVAETDSVSAKKLIFRTQPPYPYTIKIEYWKPHDQLTIRTSKIWETVNIDRLTVEAALKCLMWKKAQKTQDDPVLDMRINEISNRVSAMRARYPMKRPEVKLATYGRTDNYGFNRS